MFKSSVFLAAGGEPVLGVCATVSLLLEFCIGVVLQGVGVFCLVDLSGVGVLWCVGAVCSCAGLAVGVVAFAVGVLFVASGFCAGFALPLFLDADGFFLRCAGLSTGGAEKASRIRL